MNFPRYDGNIHPDEWIDILKDNNTSYWTALALVDCTIKLPPIGASNLTSLRDTLKKDISFTVFKNTNKRKLESLNYIPECRGGDTSKFISNFRKLCYNAEINDIEEQKKYFYKSLSNNKSFFLTEFLKRKDKINSMNNLIKEFEEIVIDESDLITNGSIVTLKHVSGKYLSSIDDLCYTTGSRGQLVFAGSFGSNALWKIMFVTQYDRIKELASYTTKSFIKLQHKDSDKLITVYQFSKHDSPSTKHREVSCNDKETCYWIENWKFNHSKLENHQGYLKSNDTINLSIEYDCKDEFLRSHDIQFTIGNDSFQEVFCHEERLGGNDEWCIELIKRA